MAMAALQYAHTSELHTAAFVRQQSGRCHGAAADASTIPLLPLSSVRKWLRGSWALLFSHADDFASYGFEADRWLMMVRGACADVDVRPLALACNSSHIANWVTEIGGRVTALPADDTRRHPVLHDAYQQVLCEAIQDATSRFVMILDDALRLRRTFAYGAHNQLPSPIDLLAMAEKLRSGGARHRRDG